jgi:hypothetical protein
MQEVIIFSRDPYDRNSRVEHRNVPKNKAAVKALPRSTFAGLFNPLKNSFPLLSCPEELPSIMLPVLNVHPLARHNRVNMMMYSERP